MDALAIEQTGLRRYVDSDSCTVYRAAGCEHCMNTGYSGRTGIHELFVLDDEIHQVIMTGADATQLHATARDLGMTTLYEDGLRKVLQGVTSMDEVLRVTRDQREDETVGVEAPVSVAAAEFMSV